MLAAMKELTRQEKLDLINNIIEHKREIDIFQEKFNELFGVANGFAGSSDGSYKVFDRMFHDYILLVARQIGETEDGIEWFVWENGCGSKGMEAGFDGQMIKVETAEDYLNLVEMIKNS